MHLKDLISLYEAMPDYLEDKKINIHKLHSLYNHVNELVQLQEVGPPLEANKDLVHLLTVSLCIYIFCFTLMCLFNGITHVLGKFDS